MDQQTRGGSHRKRSLEKQDASGFSSLATGEGNIKCEDWEQPGDQTMSIVLRGESCFSGVS